MNSTAEISRLDEAITALAARAEAFDVRLTSSDGTVNQLLTDLDTFWMLLGSILVFFMQNVIDACISALVWWAVGFAFAYGDDGLAPNPFIGGKNFLLLDDKMTSGPSFWSFWLFQWGFSAAAATIVSGAVAERCQFSAYVIYTCCITAFIYPVVVHWGWSSEGWLSAFRSPPLLGANGLIDFAGSAMVHMCGGTASIAAAYIIGPRSGRFNPDGSVTEMQGHSTVLATMGTFFLWFGWYGFNPISTLKFYGMVSTASKVAVTTTISGAAGGCTALTICFLKRKHTDIAPLLNGILGGLVGVTSACSTIDAHDALIIGIVAGVVYFYFAEGLIWLRIDDPLEASAVHLGCGVWGVIAAGLFPNKTDTCTSGYQGCADHYGLFYGGGIAQLGIQLLAVLAIGAWSLVTSGLLFFILNKLGRLRVSKRDEDQGLDISHHGGSAYAFNHYGTSDMKSSVPILPGPA
ncbi:hypothetical protein BSKO_08256 [Bryopsis sp. KO-2023]|nr:hypothetical protein BSKO_08256 [Bryopsis sp. KO-2023]